VVPRGRRVRIPGIAAHQTLILAEQDRFEVRGLPVLAPARLLLDLGDLTARRRLLARELERSVHEAQIRWGLTLTLRIDDVLWEFDACFPSQRVAVELDSERFHSTGWARGRDRHKGNVAALTGWTLLRYVWRDLVGDDRRALAEHRRALSPSPRRPAAPGR
jgi:hypothetical protein